MVATFMLFMGLKFTGKKKKKHNVKKTCEIYCKKMSAWLPVFYRNKNMVCHKTLNI